jgi:hypothetical protein
LPFRQNLFTKIREEHLRKIQASCGLKKWGVFVNKEVTLWPQKPAKNDILRESGRPVIIGQRNPLTQNQGQTPP